MISVVTQHGTSFKGLMAYLMHDIGSRDSAERVAWTHTHNLATDDPEKAWRIMASTARSQDELKAEAGVKNTGRKSHAHVMHYVLSWHPQEHGEYRRADMIGAALASMTYLGVSEGEKVGKKVTAKRTQRGIEHQAVIVCHDEGPGKNPHVHVMLNRVHPEHGVMLPDSKDYEKLSAWALDYRRAEGKEHLCPERVKNAAKKAQGVLTSHPRKPRNVFEQEQAIAEAEPNSHKKSLLEQQLRRAKELKARTERMKRDQATAVQALEERQIAAERSKRDEMAEAMRASRAQIRENHAPEIDALKDRQTTERGAFFEAHESAAGRVRNAWEAFKTKQWMREIRTQPISAIKHGFALAFDAGMQLRDIERHHEREMAELRSKRRAEEHRMAQEIRATQEIRQRELREVYLKEHNDTILRHKIEAAKQRAEWHQLAQDRKNAVAEDGRACMLDRSTESDLACRPATGAARDESDGEQSSSGSTDQQHPRPQPADDADERFEAFMHERDRHRDSGPDVASDQEINR